MNLKLLSEIETNLQLDKDNKQFREELFKKALNHRLKVTSVVTAITGSSGKTTVKEILSSILSKSYAEEAAAESKFFISLKNHNTKIAIATQVLGLDQHVKQAIFEVGARKINDFDVPFSLLRPDVVVLLNLGSAHVGEFGSFENLKKEKLSVATKPSIQTIVYNLDQAEYADLSDKSKKTKTIYTFGRNSKAHVCLIEENEKRIQFSMDGKTYNVDVKQQAPNLGINFVAVVATAKALKIKNEFILKGLEEFTLPQRRFQKLVYKNSVIIDDSFNASYESYKTGLEFLFATYLPTYKLQHQESKIILVLGAMKELGPYSKEIHLKISQIIQSMIGSDLVHDLRIVFIDQDIQFLQSIFKEKGIETYYYKDVFEAKAKSFEWFESDRLIYLKGAKSLKLDSIYDYIHT